MSTMRRIKLGDVFKIETQKGNIYLQFADYKKGDCELVRVLEIEQGEDNEQVEYEIGKKELFLVHFPLKVAYKQGIIRFIENFNLPSSFEVPKKMRSPYTDKDGNILYWHIVDCDTLEREKVYCLSEEQKKLSPWGMWNDTLLIERLNEGWSLEKWI